MIRILIADDHEMFREMLHLALSRTPEFEVVGQAADGKEAVALAKRLHPDVVVLDYKMPEVPDFTALVREIRCQQANPEVIVLSALGSATIGTRAAEGGARGYVLKSTRLSVLTDAIRAVDRGETWIDSNLDRRIFGIFERAGLQQPKGKDDRSLSRREREVLACAAQGICNKEIAARLGVSQHTVGAHLKHIFAKLQVKSRLAAALVYHGEDYPREDHPNEQNPAT